MSYWGAPSSLITECCTDLPKLSAERREAIVQGPKGRDEHGRLAAEIGALNLVEACPPVSPALPPIGAARVVFWNAERGTHLDAAAGLLGGLGADIVLLCEMDDGMARSAQRHTARELARGLGGLGYVFGVEFVELGLGDARESARHAGGANRHGLHGAAILAPSALARPALIRFETDGDWFGGAQGQLRIGGRIAIAAIMPLAGTDVLFVTVHLESHSDPDFRGRQMQILLNAVNRHAPGMPAVIGGDFNTCSMARGARKDAGKLSALLAEDPDRLLNPQPYEPLFAIAEAEGFDWRAGNGSGPTQRPKDGAAGPLGRIDWFFTRGVTAADPATIAAVDATGAAISDHELISVTIAPTV
ncbi:MAG: endonuclease/exonuclease/phosphatase family protein [Proteobacteria bacterium]|nr:endonuclease/exonuclease/phosphatase family protein [Pseudomonadota bacterium]